MEDYDKTKDQLIEELRIYQIELEMQKEELKKAHVELEKSRDRFSDLYNFAQVGYVTISETGLIVEANLRIAALLVVERGKLINRPFSSFVIREDQDTFYSHRKECLDRLTQRTCELRMVRSDGTEFYAQMESMAVVGDNEPQGALRASITDVTEQKRKEHALRANEEMFRTILATTPVGIGLAQDRTMKWVNDAWLKMFGYENQQECIGRNSSMFYSSPEEYERMGKELYQDLATGNVTGVYAKGRKKDGSLFDAHVRLKLVDPAQPGGPAIAAVTDITERKLAEKAHRETQQRLELALKGAELGWWDLDLTTGTGFVDDRIYEIIDYSPGELECTLEEWQNHLHPEDIAGTLEHMQEHLLGHRDRLNYEYRVRKKSGEYAWLMAQGKIVERDKDNRPLRMAGTVRDITARKAVEEKLQKTQERLELALKAANIGLWDLDVPTGRATINERAVEIVGYTLDEVEATVDYWQSSIHPDDMLGVLESFTQSVEGLQDFFEEEYRVRTKDGNYVWLQTRGNTVARDATGKALRMSGTFMDVTEQRRMQEALHDSQERLELALKGADLGMWDLDVRTGQGVINERFAELAGYTLDEIELTQNFWQNSIHPDDATRVMEDFNKAVEGLKDSFQSEYRLRTKSGEYVWVSARGKVVEQDEHGRPLRVAGTTMDITARKQSEDALQASEEKYSRIVETVNEGIWEVDSQFNMTFVNPKLTEMVGYTVEELVGSPITLLLFQEDIAYQDEQLHRRMQGTRDVYERRMRHKDGSEIWILVSATPIFDAQGNFQGSFGTFSDITKLKATERTLRDSEEKFSKAFRYAPVFMGITDLHDGTVLEANDTLFEMTGLSPGEVIGKTSLELGWIVEEGRARVSQGVSEQGRISGMELKLPTKDGREITCSYTSQLIHINERPVILSIGHDVSELRRSQAELQNEKDKLNSILDNMNDGVCMVSPQYEIEYINPVLETTFGMVGGRKCHAYFHDRIEPCPWCVNQRVFAGESVHREWRSEKTGKTYELFHTPVRHTGGSVSKLEIFHDITAWKQAENGLRKSEERFRQVVESTGDWIWEIDENGMYTYCAPASERILGYSVDELVGKKSFYDFFVPEFKEDLKIQAFAAFQSKEPFRNFVNPNVRKDGHIVILETSGSPIIDEEGKLTGYRGADTDMTERVQAQEAQLRLLAAIEQATEGIVIMDPEGTVEYVNAGYEHITGYRRDEVLGKKHHLFDPNEHDEEFSLQVQETVLKGMNWSGRCTRTRKDGFSYPEELVASPVCNSSGKTVNYVVIKRDVTEQLSLQQQLFQAQKMEAVGTLAGGIAHDFNNILQVVLGFSELLLAAKEKVDADYDALDKINSASRRGADLVQNLMMFSRKVEPNLKPLNLNGEIVQIQKLLSRTIPKDVKITVRLSGDLHLVEADVSQMGQVLMNLAVNARDAMPNGGNLNFETSNIELDEDYCTTHPGSRPGNYVLLGVSDTGTGMTKETVSHIFEPFFTTKGIGHGTGLGLATVYGIVKQHKGYITCESEVGTGTTFRIYLPAIDKELEDEIQDSKAPIVGGTETILLVDDEEHLRDLGVTILKRYGYKVITASNGKEALETYHRESDTISLIILDLIMPEMDGRKCLAVILTVNPKAKVLIASGHSEGFIASDTSFPGAKALVTKPYEMRKLLQAVREVLDGD